VYRRRFQDSTRRIGGSAELLISADSNTNRLARLPYTLELVSAIEKSRHTRISALPTCR